MTIDRIRSGADDAKAMARIMISSTSEDLVEHRERLLATLRRMEQDSVGMEFFGAVPGTPVSVCVEEVDRADLLVLVVAHRYGWIPRKEDGGDGTSSITRLEFQRALKPRQGEPKPVLAFVVDPKAEWVGGREQDRLVSAETEAQAQDVWRAVQALKELRREVGGLVRDTFSSPADLADKAGSAVAKWLLKRQSLQQQDALAERALQELMQRVAKHLQEQNPELALTYLVDAASTADPVNLAAIADKRLEIAVATYSPNENALQAAANEVLQRGGQRRVEALRTLGKCKSQLARSLWKNEPEKAWALAQTAREHLEMAIAEDPLNPDTYGTLGGLFKRMATWAGDDAKRARELEDSMLDAYKRGADSSLHAYPLLNYLEQRATIDESRNPALAGRPLFGESEATLRQNLAKSLKSRELQLGNSQDRPWAAFDLARGRHYLRPNVPGFLEDLERAVEEARSVARVPEDRYMVTTTVDSLECLLQANVQLEGLAEGIQLLKAAVKDDDWYMGRPKKAPPYLEQELLTLRAAVTEASKQSQSLAGFGTELARFIQATEVRWTREDEEIFQTELVEWKKSLEPRQLKILRGFWKIFGQKTLEQISGPVPIDWEAAAQVVTAAISGLEKSVVGLEE
jgi:hypothetical protein